MKASNFLLTTLSSAIIAVSMSGCNEESVADFFEEVETSRGADFDLDNNNLDVEDLTEELATSTKQGCAITQEQEKMIEQINIARAEARFCGDENFTAAQPVVWNCKLEQAGWSHTEDMIENNFFSHTGSDGLHAGDRVDATGYNWRVYGENLAAGFTNEEETVAGLLESPGHCKNLMNPKFKEFGSARMFSDTNDYISYWTHVFGTAF